MAVPQVTFEVTTTSEQIPSWDTPAQPPQITLNGNALPAPGNKPYTATGWQVVVLDQAMDMTQSSAILSNFFVVLNQDNGAWAGIWEAMYAQMTQQVLTSGDPQTQVVIIASYGLDYNTPPTNDALGLMLGYGAGAQLQGFITSATDAGSEGGDWTSQPANYVLIGANSLPYGQGTEAFQFGTDGQPVKTTVSATFANPAGEAAPAAVGTASVGETGSAGETGY